MERESVKVNRGTYFRHPLLWKDSSGTIVELRHWYIKPNEPKSLILYIELMLSNGTGKRREHAALKDLLTSQKTSIERPPRQALGIHTSQPKCHYQIDCNYALNMAGVRTTTSCSIKLIPI